MKKLIVSLHLFFALILNTACSPEDAATAVAVGAGLIYVASIDNDDYVYRNGSYYYRTPSCNRNYEYFDAYGRSYYPSDCINNNGRSYVSFGIVLALGLLVYK